MEAALFLAVAILIIVLLVLWEASPFLRPIIGSPNSDNSYIAMNPSVRFLVSLAAVISLATSLVAAALFAQPASHDTFDPHDTRVFKSAACTKDHHPVEALYYIVASRGDMANSNSSPSSQLMKEEVDRNWQHIASQLKGEQVMEERFATTYHSILSEHIPRLQQAVQEQSGVSISVTEVNSRPMDLTKDKDVPSCSVP